MSQIALSPPATGTGVFTIAAPATNTNQTLTLPDATGTVTTSEAVTAAGYTTPAAVLTQFNASGAAPVFAARAWVNFNGIGTVAIRASGNVSSITRNGTGDYTVNFATAMQDVNFCAVGNHNGSNQNLNPTMVSSTVSSFRFVTTGGAGAGSGVSLNNVDPSVVQMSFFR